MKSIFVKLFFLAGLVVASSAMKPAQAEPAAPMPISVDYCNEWSAATGYSDCHSCIYIPTVGTTCQ